MRRTAKTLKNFCDAYGYGFRPDYSGRFMYGKTCVGIVGNSVNDILTDLANEGFSLSGYQTDNMGLGYIVYFTSIKGV